jgi:hypothetical protein
LPRDPTHCPSDFRRKLLCLAAVTLSTGAILIGCPANSLLENVKQHVQQVQSPPATWASPYTNGCQIAAIEVLQVTSTSVDLQATGITVSGIGTGIGTLGVDNRTITISPGPTGTGLWTGPGTLTVSATAVDGTPFTKTLSVAGVFNGICVSANRGSDSVPNNGSVRLPFFTVKKAADTAAASYGSTPNSVLVARSATAYLVDGRSAGGRVVLSASSSLLGEYADDFQSRSISSPPGTTLTDSNTSTDASNATNPNRVIELSAGNTGTVEGLTVNGGTGAYTTAVYCKAASPTIRKMTLRSGGNGASNAQRVGLWIEGAASPTVDTNVFNDSPNGGGTSVGEADGIYILNLTGTPVILNNTICGGVANNTVSSGNTTIGISMNGGTSTSLKVVKNTFVPGIGDVATAFLYPSGSSIGFFENNLVEVGIGQTGGSSSVGVSVSGSSSVLTVRNNTFVLGYPLAIGVEAGIRLIGIGTASTFYADNNIFHDYGAVTSIYGVLESGASTPDSFKNNLFSYFVTNGAILYHNSTPADYLSVAAMATGINGELASSASSNAAAEPIGFVNAGAGNFHLTSTNVQGIDGSALGWGFTDDRDGITRTGNLTTGWSVGCYEKD